jgi:outer membrane protein assembly factor BamE (lipoprotein component of BamABCDE complex)
MFKIGFFTAVISVFVLSGCSTPQERAEERQRAYELEQQMLKQREDGYKNTCASYGYKVGTPQFNQCVATERHQYEAEERDRQAAKERQELEAGMIRQAQKDKRRRRSECHAQDKFWAYDRCI